MGEAVDTIALTATTGGPIEPIAVPRRLGHYDLERQIGVGGMGEVWLARDEALGRRVAVKFLLTARVNQLSDSAELLEGVRAVCSIRHENLVSVFAADIHDRVPYLVMEFVDGRDLREVVRGSGPLPPELAASAMLRVAEGVAALHREGVVHRDIKPANVLVDASDRLLVTDFGLASQRRMNELRSSVEAVAGSPAYMAPEAFEGEVSLRTDVYALGCTLYELLTGEVPYSGAIAVVEKAHREGNFPIERIEAIDADLADVISRATRPALVYRYKDARAFAGALREALGDRVDEEPGRRLWTLASGQKESAQLADRTPGSDYYSRLTVLAKGRKSDPDLGERSESEDAEATAAPARRNVIGWPLPCHGCELELTQAVVGGVCPECGTPVQTSLHAEHAVSGSAIWLRVQSLMAIGLTITPLFLLTAGLGQLLLTVAASAVTIDADEMLPHRALLLLVPMPLYAGVIISGIGAAWPHSSGARYASPPIAAVGVVVAIGHVFLLALGAEMIYGNALLRAAEPVLRFAPLALVTLSLVVDRHLPRVTHARVATAARISAIAAAVAGVWLGFVALIGPPTAGGSPSGMQIALTAVGVMIVVAAVGAAAWTGVRLSGALVKLARAAEARARVRG
ncbi:MAG: hypothetical protein CMJ31_05975 [Phycisphaerae bacterium]|nr:hypothetical protein [Phycisphaerae bacterium]